MDASGDSRAAETETIGRLPHLLTHMGAQLPALADGRDSFEDIRAGYGKTLNALAARGLARVTAPRAGVGAHLRYWSSVRDLVKELQTLGWVERGIPVPSTKNTVDAYRARRYPLTDAGRRVAEVAADRRALADLLTDAALLNHPYLVALVKTLRAGPIFCPEFTDRQMAQKLGSAHYAMSAAERLNRSDPRVHVDPIEIETHLRSALARRFGKRREQGLEITNKERADAASDALSDFALQQRGLHFGATTLDNLVSWGRELRLLDDSRYVPGHDGGNLIWLCCDLEDRDGRLTAARRPYGEHAETVAMAVISNYFELRDLARAAPRDEPGPSGDYQLIHVVRAAAAFATGTAREVADRALEDLAAGGQPQLGVKVRLLAARFEEPPRSEPMYARGGTRALHLTISRVASDDAVTTTETQ